MRNHTDEDPHLMTYSLDGLYCPLEYCRNQNVKLAFDSLTHLLFPDGSIRRMLADDTNSGILH